MEDKYIVFALEEKDGSGPVWITTPCFEYLISSSDKEEAYLFAEEYSRAYRLRTVVVKGVMFG